MNVLLLSTLLFALAACSEQPNVKIDAYRYISFEDIQRIKWGKEVPRADWGKVIADPYWYLTHHMKGAVADTFFFYGNFDSIRIKIPPDTYGYMYRKATFKAARWVPKPNYGELLYIDKYETDSLPGIYVTFYATPDRSSVLQIYYTDPGKMTTPTLFHKDSINILKKDGIIIDPRDELQ